jgi:hypothetical protein
MQPYSPFTVELSSISTADLAALRGVAEGWYIEYKREMPNAANLAKSLSAFANTYGGWLFIGITETSKEHPTAGAFPGVSRENVDAFSQRMRKSAADHLQPSPHFELRVLWGPSGEVGLPEDYAIICVWVPQSNSAPHVHKNGVIYRRVSDASEPRPESDRFVLDQLFRRGDKLRERYREWHDQDPEFNESEKDKPYVRLMLTADLWRQRDFLIESEDNVRVIMGNNESSVAIPFDNVYPTSYGFIGRQLLGNDLHHLSLTWRLNRNLSSDVYVPLTIYQPEQWVSLQAALIGYENVGRFIKVLEPFQPGFTRVIDLNFLFGILLGVAGLQRRLLKSVNWFGPYYFKAKILNAWRTVPFIDSPTFLDQLEKFGPTMCLESTTVIPSGFDPESFAETEATDESKDDLGLQISDGHLMFSLISMAFGVSHTSTVSNTDNLNKYLSELLEAGRRALDFQTQRNTVRRR